MTTWPLTWTRGVRASRQAIARRNAREAARECRARRLERDRAEQAPAGA